MIRIENVKVVGMEEAIRGMRNPMNSWEKSDSRVCDINTYGELAEGEFVVGSNDHNLMMRLARGGSVHAKYRRMITVYVDIIAPLYWWKEFDTYKVGTVANSCSTMHKIDEKEFTLEDFSCEHLIKDEENPIYSVLNDERLDGGGLLDLIVNVLNHWRNKYLKTKDKKYWWQMIQLLPSSYNQRRTLLLNYEVLANIYKSRKNHKLDEWCEFCDWIELLPYNEIITVSGKEKCDD